jgi:hypothetical protein
MTNLAFPGQLVHPIQYACFRCTIPPRVAEHGQEIALNCFRKRTRSPQNHDRFVCSGHRNCGAFSESYGAVDERSRE